MSASEPPFGPEEAARRLGVPVSWLKTHRDEVPHVRMGRFRRYTQAHLDAYIARQTVEPKPYAPTARSQARRKRAA